MRRAVLVAAALAAGAAHALSFAPFDLPWLQLLALAALFGLTTRVEGWRTAAQLGVAFGLGWFGVGVSWVYISMHVYGLMPAPLAGAATLAFCAFLALYPALALGVAQRVTPGASIRLPLLLPAVWTLSEWLRGTLFTGFPWLAGGYAHTDSVLAGFAPVAGVYGVTLAAALLAGALALIALPLRARGRRGYVCVAGSFVVLIGGGVALKGQAWTQPAGAPFSVRLVQANIPQDTKFGPEGLQRAFEAHWALVQGPRVDLVALPESVYPVPLQFVPPQYLDAFENLVRTDQTSLVFGVFLEQPAGAYYNSAIGLAPGDARPARYSKRHLVPFGEFIPPGFRWFVDLMQMPIGDQQRGAAVQPAMELAGQRVAVNICYEDLFGEVIIDAWKGNAPPTVMLNMSNLAWFQDSLALPQHLQISRMRVLETQHPMLRATNTGATAIIDARGRVTGALPFLAAGALTGEVQGMEGMTPFVRWGNGPAVTLSLLLGLAAAALSRRRYPTTAEAGT
ncbi:MAG TPA: apolipoprotein N-acyltransferase [Burkholderiaceae bacterium]|nr:apolipoprotein N-acyltransferase [Burkholderiaceae bacterium]